MWTAIVGLALLVLLSAWMTRVNARHERRRLAANGGNDDEAGAEDSADDRVADAWDSFGPAEGPEAVRAVVDRLLVEAPVEALERKSSLIALAVMAARAERYDVLGPVAARAERVDGRCGETAALGVLAAAYAGDAPRAREMLARSRSAMAGCASCGAGPDTRLLMQEVELALTALSEGALGPADEASVEPGSATATPVVVVRAVRAEAPRVTRTTIDEPADASAVVDRS